MIPYIYKIPFMIVHDTSWRKSFYSLDLNTFLIALALAEALPSSPSTTNLGIKSIMKPQEPVLRKSNLWLNKWHRPKREMYKYSQFEKGLVSSL